MRQGLFCSFHDGGGSLLAARSKQSNSSLMACSSKRWPFGCWLLSSEDLETWPLPSFRGPAWAVFQGQKRPQGRSALAGSGRAPVGARPQWPRPKKQRPGVSFQEQPCQGPLFFLGAPTPVRSNRIKEVDVMLF